MANVDAAVSWPTARRIAAHSIREPRSALARLDEAVGCVLAQDITVLAEDPPVDCAAIAGFAVRGMGPWAITNAAVLNPGHAVRVSAGDPLPDGSDAVLGERQARVFTDAHEEMLVSGVDPRTGLRDPALRPMLGSGITPQGSQAQRGTVLVPRGRVATPAVLAAAAASGHDDVKILAPPTVETIVIGQRLTQAGLPRPGRPRDTLAIALPGIARSFGARTAPVREARTLEHLRAELADTSGEVVILAGSLSRRPDTMIRAVLQERQAHWLVDGVAMTPGAGVMLARLPDDRVVIGVSAEPRAAMAGVLTVLPGVVAALRGRSIGDPPTVALGAPAPFPDFMQNTRIFPVRLDLTDDDPRAVPLEDGGPQGLGGWAMADAFAVATPGTGHTGDRVHLLTVPT